MGRTLHYSLFASSFGADQLRLAERRDIELAERMLQNRFSWSCEDLSLTLSDHMEITYADSLVRTLGAPRLGSGMTKVADDEWNALLIVRFVRWVSLRLPTVTVRIHDEGDFIHGGYLIYQAGRPSLDRMNIERWRVYLQKHDLDEYVGRLDEAERLAEKGVFFAEVPAADYAEVKEIGALGIPKDELARMTLHDVAARFTFPWETEWIPKP